MRDSSHYTPVANLLCSVVHKFNIATIDVYS